MKPTYWPKPNVLPNVEDCQARAEVMAIYDHGSMRSLHGLPAKEQRKYLDDRVERARAYARWRCDSYEDGSCAHPW